MALTKVGLALALLIAAKPAAADPPAAPCTTVAPVAIAPPAAPAPTGVNPCTTPPPPKMTCTNYQCPSGYLPKGAVFCGNAGDPDCGRDVCCTIVTTVTTTPGLTCDGFTCPKGWSKNANAEHPLRCRQVQHGNLLQPEPLHDTRHHHGHNYAIHHSDDHTCTYLCRLYLSQGLVKECKVGHNFMRDR